RVLREREVCDGGLLEEVGLPERFELARALEEEEELRRQRVARHIPVEQGQEWIRVRLLEQQRRSHARGQALREGGLAGTDRSLDDDVAMLHALSFPRRANRADALPFPGITASGQISRSGSSTNARSCARG